MRNGFKRIVAVLIATLVLLGALPAGATGMEQYSESVVPGIDLYSELESVNQADQAVTLDDGDVTLGNVTEITLTVGDVVTLASGVDAGNRDVDSDEHRESWASSRQAVATVVGNQDGRSGDDRYRQSTAILTAVAPGETTITHTYYTQGFLWLWSSHSETIRVIVDAPIYTVTFDIGDEAKAAGVSVPDAVNVTGGETVSSLPTLEWRDADGNFAKIFAGWYSDEELTREFTETTPVNAHTTLYARWVDADVEGIYYVNFYSQDGGTVHLTLAAAEGRTVGPATGPVLEGKAFIGWSTIMQGDSPASELIAFDFSTPVSDAATEDTLNLYAWYADAVQVFFVSNGGTAVPTQTVAQGDMATYVEPVRVGYTFVGWSTDSETFTEFVFTTPITANITLYAFWEANMVPVRLVYMYENADDDDYSSAGYSETVYAPAGSYLSIEKSNITNMNGTHSVRYSDTSNGALTGNAKTTESGNANATIRDIRDTYFQYNTATNNRLVMPDGSTVVLVYYNRARVTLTFTYDGSDAYGAIDYTSLISAEDRAKYDVTYNQGRSSFTYTFTAKYGQDITAVWPQVGWVRNSNGDTPSYNGNYFYGWKLPNSDTVQVTNRYTLESDLIGSRTIVDGILTASSTLPSRFQDVDVYWLIYARTTLPGEEADFVYNNVNYTIYVEACQQAYASSDFNPKELAGCTAVNVTFSGTYRSLGNSLGSGNNRLQAVNGTIKGKFDEVFEGENIGNNDSCQILIYNRDSVTLTVFPNDDTYETTAQPADYLYGDWIYNDADDLLSVISENMSRMNYRFAGWYTDPDFTTGTEYNLTVESRIYGNLNLYAKWEPDQFLAEYYLYRDDLTPYAEQGFAEGGYIEDKLVPVEVQSSFLGWYWYNEAGQLVPFDFTSAVGANFVDEDGVLKLYAMWSGENGTVIYTPGIGWTTDDSKRVVDTTSYEINSAMVCLEEPNDLDGWSGAVPQDEGLTFVGWKAPNGTIYQPGRYVLVTRQLMEFEAQWSADAVTLIYDGNGADSGANVTERWERGSEVTVWDNMDATQPHFVRTDYVLIGWSRDPNATEPEYALGEDTITLTADETTLYAVWQKATSEIMISKTVESGLAADLEQEFTFTYTVDGEETATSFILRNDGATTITVPAGSAVTVTETANDGFSTKYSVDGTEAADGVAAAIASASTDGHAIAFTNTRKLGSITVSKTVTGSMGDQQEDFTFSYSYELNGERVTDTFTLRHGEENQALANLPVGTVVTITEIDYTGDNGGYKTSYVVNDGTSTTGSQATLTVAEGKNTVTFTNHKDADIPTGIVTDSLPYIIILASVIAIGAVVIIRRRRQRDD